MAVGDEDCRRTMEAMLHVTMTNGVVSPAGHEILLHCTGAVMRRELVVRGQIIERVLCADRVRRNAGTVRVGVASPTVVSTSEASER